MNTELFRPITNDAEYQAAMARLDELFSLGETHRSQADLNELGALAILVEHYELQQHGPMPSPTAAGAIKYELERRGISQAELARRMQVAPSRISEIVTGKRELWKDEIRAIHRELGIPAEVLLQPLS